MQGFTLPGPELKRQYRRVAYPLAWAVTLTFGPLIIWGFFKLSGVF